METNSNLRLQSTDQNVSDKSKYKNHVESQSLQPSESNTNIPSKKEIISRPCAIIGPDALASQYQKYDEYSRAWSQPHGGVTSYCRPGQVQYFTDHVYPPRNISPRHTFQENMTRFIVPSPTDVKYRSDSHNLSANVSNPNIILPSAVNRNVTPDVKFCEGRVLVNPQSHAVDILRSQYNKNNEIPPARYDTQAQTIPPYPHGFSVSNVHELSYNPYSNLYNYPAEMRYPLDYQHQGIQLVKGNQVYQKMPEQSPFVVTNEYAPGSYSRINNIRYEPYPSMSDKCLHPRYDYSYKYATHHTPHSSSSKTSEFRKRNIPDMRYYPVPPKYLESHSIIPNPDFCGKIVTRRNQSNVPYHLTDIPSHHSDHYGAQEKFYGFNIYEKSNQMSLNSRMVPDTSKIKLDYLNRYRNLPYSDVRYTGDSSQNCNRPNVTVPVYNYPMKPPEVHHPESINFQKPLENIHGDRNVDPEALNYQKAYYNQKYGSYNPLAKIPTEFSPNIISPTESSTSCESNNTTSHQLFQEDGGYVSQCSTTSGQSADFQFGYSKNSLYDSQNIYPQMPIRQTVLQNSNFTTSHAATESTKSSYKTKSSKPSIDVRQYLEMWDEEYEDAKIPKTATESTNAKVADKSSQPSTYVATPPSQQLYVLDKVTINSNDLHKYEHIQKVTKLPDNIKEYEIESIVQNSRITEKDIVEKNNEIFHKYNAPRENPNFNINAKSKSENCKSDIGINELIDVEAKISQSVIHKEVRYNFEIKPCSPGRVTGTTVEIQPAQNLFKQEHISVSGSQVNKIPKHINKVEQVTKRINKIRKKEEIFSEALKNLPTIEVFPKPLESVCSSLPEIDLMDIDNEKSHPISHHNKNPGENFEPHIVFNKAIKNNVIQQILPNISGKDLAKECLKQTNEEDKVSLLNSDNDTNKENLDSELTKYRKAVIQAVPSVKTIILNKNDASSAVDYDKNSSVITMCGKHGEKEEVTVKENGNYIAQNSSEVDLLKTSNLNAISDTLVLNLSVELPKKSNETERQSLHEEISDICISNDILITDSKTEFDNNVDIIKSSPLYVNTPFDPIIQNNISFPEFLNKNIEKSEISSDCNFQQQTDDCSIALDLCNTQTEDAITDDNNSNNLKLCLTSNIENLIHQADTLVTLPEVPNSLCSDMEVEIPETQLVPQKVCLETSIEQEIGDQSGKQSDVIKKLETTKDQTEDLNFEKQLEAVKLDVESKNIELSTSSNISYATRNEYQSQNECNLKCEIGPIISQEECKFDLNNLDENISTHNFEKCDEKNEHQIEKECHLDLIVSKDPKIERSKDSQHGTHISSQDDTEKLDDKNDPQIQEECDDNESKLDLNISTYETLGKNDELLSLQEEKKPHDTNAIMPFINKNSSILPTDEAECFNTNGTIETLDYEEIIIEETHENVLSIIEHEHNMHENQLNIANEEENHSFDKIHDCQLEISSVNITEIEKIPLEVIQQENRDTEIYQPLQENVQEENFEISEKKFDTEDFHSNVSPKYQKDTLLPYLNENAGDLFMPNVFQQSKREKVEDEKIVLTDLKILNTVIVTPELHSHDTISSKYVESLSIGKDFLESPMNNSVSCGTLLSNDIDEYDTIMNDDLAIDAPPSTTYQSEPCKNSVITDILVQDIIDDGSKEEVNGLELGGCWIDDIACIETVVSEDVDIHQTEMIDSNSVCQQDTWGSYSENIANQYLEMPADSEDSKLSIKKDANSNIVIQSNQDADKAHNYIEDILHAMHSGNNFSENISKKDTFHEPVQTQFKREATFKIKNSEYFKKRKICKFGHSKNAKVMDKNFDITISHRIEDNFKKSTQEKKKSSDNKNVINNYKSNKHRRSEENSLVNVQSNHFPMGKIMTKGAQKYIPPISDSDIKLKCHLPLPKQKLISLSKHNSKSEIVDKTIKNDNLSINRMVLPKINSKPKFEDVLKTIDKHISKINKFKFKKAVPKMIIKKDERGSHYASTSVNSRHSPDMTGNKWQPWVCLQRSDCIEEMIKNNISIALCVNNYNCSISSSGTSSNSHYSVQVNDHNEVYPQTEYPLDKILLKKYSTKFISKM